jgi:hypothetical protein
MFHLKAVPQLLLSLQFSAHFIKNIIKKLSVSRLYFVDDGMINGCRALSGIRMGRRNRSTQRKSGSVALCPHQIQQGANWDRV